MIDITGREFVRIRSPLVEVYFLRSYPGSRPSTATVSSGMTSPKPLSGEQVARHTSRESCWIIVHGEGVNSQMIRSLPTAFNSDVREQAKCMM